MLGSLIMLQRTGMTLADLITRVAEVVGVQRAPQASGDRAGVPTNTHHLDKVKRAINDGLSKVCRDFPRFHGLRRTMTIALDPTTPGATSVNGDVSQQIISSAATVTPVGSWVCKNDSGYRSHLRMVHISELLSQSPLTAFPTMIAFEPVQRSSTQDTPSWSVHVWPTPGEAVTITGQIIERPGPMVENTDRHQLGAEHDLTVMHAAIVEMLRGHPDRSVVDAAKADYSESLASSVRLENKREPNQLGTTETGTFTSTTHGWLGVSDPLSLTL